MAGDWPVQRLPELLTLQRGHDLASDKRVNGTFPVIAATGKVGSHNEAKCDAPGVVIGRSGSIGGAQWIDKPFWPLNTTLYVVDFKGNNPYFCYSILKSIDFQRFNAGSGVPTLNRNHLVDIEVPAISRTEQDSIANFLFTLDAKIDLNREMVATMEEMARALFKSWFVDFDPVHARTEGRDTGLPVNIAALFPNSFDNAGLPDGWRGGSLDDLADINTESWKGSTHPEEIEYVDLSNCKWGNIDGTTLYRWDDAPSRARRVARAGDTIFGTVRPGNGSYAFVGREGLTVSTGFAVLRPKEVIYREIVYFAATSTDNIRRLEQLAAGHGGAYPAVNPDKVSATAVTVPGEKVAEAFASTTAVMIDRIESLKQESTGLEQLRDTLLPKLLSGELRVADAASEIAAA